MADLVRIINTDGSVQLLEMSNSQVVALLEGVPREQRKLFDGGEESITLPSGRNVKLCDPSKATFNRGY